MVAEDRQLQLVQKDVVIHLLQVHLKDTMVELVVAVVVDFMQLVVAVDLQP